jgi:hypothetical protein
VFSFARDKWYPYSRFLRRVTTRDDGTFSVRGLPGDAYYVAELPPDARLEGAWQEPSVLEVLTAAAALVTVGEGQAATVALRR